MSHHVPLRSSPKGFVAFLLLQEGSSRRQRPKTLGLQGLTRRRGKDKQIWEVKSLLVHTSKALSWQLLWAGKETCLVRGEPGVAKNPAEQEEHRALGPRSDCDCQITAWAGGALCACPLGRPSPWLKSWGQPLGLLQGLSPVKEKCLYPQGSGRCRGVLAPVVQHKWQSSSSSAATCLEHSPLHGRPSAGMGAHAASPWQAACGSWCCCSFLPDAK